MRLLAAVGLQPADIACVCSAADSQCCIMC